MKKLQNLVGICLLISCSLLVACGDDDSDDLCNETCTFSDDQDCDDGGSGSDTSLCDLGTDCIDCGPR